MLQARFDGYVRAELTAAPGETLAVVGPNGAGKTTVLRALAGLPAPAAARIRLDGRDLTAAAPHERSVGYVPQSGALFPHLSALANVAYGLRARGLRRRPAERAAREWLDRLAVAELAHRRPAELSGGQGGRVALARALAVQPRILLLDEPLAPLDAATRVHVRHDLRAHLRGYGGVCLVVTHDPVDAVALSDRMLVLESGILVQDADPATVTAQPRSPWIARMLGRNAYRGTSTQSGIALDEGDVNAADAEGGPEPDTEGADVPGCSGRIPVGRSPAGPGRTLVTAETVPPGHPALATVHPEAVGLYSKPPEGSPRNSWAGTVAETSPAGSRVRVAVSGLGGPDIVAEITPAALAGLALAEGAEVWVSVKATEVTLTQL